MTDSPRQSVFDNRYRYDYIYPRGRSGETLRAWDTQDHDRPVVIKRPAPQDAPPLRAAQEVSIKAERKALERLAGHPVVAELRGVGSFRVGGQSQEYIAIDRAEGDIVEDMVLALAQRNERLPLLEVLVIVDNLLDLLAHAHEEQVVYNDVDAKHLFWNRDTYELTVIDWGNAVLLDEAGRQAGVTRQTDVYQVGELLFFILTGGSRLVAEAGLDGQHSVNFGVDMVRIPPNLQVIVARATHPNTRKRHTTITELRDELREIQRPLAQKRDAIIGDAERALSRPLSQVELDSLATQLDEILATDPGYPVSRRLRASIEMQRKRLGLQADIDAARIYLDNANWSRARDLMLDLLDEADEVIAPVIQFIIAGATLLEKRGATTAPPTLAPALDALLQGDVARAGQRLMAPVEGNAPNEEQFLLADRMSALIPNVILLRPPLAHLESELNQLGGTKEAAKILDAIADNLNDPIEARLQPLINIYRSIGKQFQDLRPIVEKLTTDHGLAYDDLLDPLGRAQTATQAIQQQLDVASMNAFSNPSRAGDGLRAAIAVDSMNDNLKNLNAYFTEIHQAVEAVGTFKPNADGSNLAGWFERVLTFMRPYGDDIDDRAFHQALNSLEKSARLWTETQEALIMGRRFKAQENLNLIASHLQALNVHVGEWTTKTVRQVQDATHVERLSPNTKLAQRLMEGYQTWDAGKFGQTAEVARQIADYAQTAGEENAVQRLERLGEIAHRWLKEGGTGDVDLTQQAEQAALNLLMPEETTYHNQFIADSRQSEDLYLKMMGRGLVEWMRNSSSAGVRALFMHYVFSGMLSAYDDDFEEANFWREATLKTAENARTNPLFAEFDRFLTGRQLVIEVQAVLNNVQSPQDLLSARNLLNQPMADQWLGDVQGATRQLEEGLTAWEDGNFQAARFATEESLRKLRRTQDNFRIELGGFIKWVEPLMLGATELHGKRREIERIANTTRATEDGTPETPDPILEDHLKAIVETTVKLLGADSSYQVRQWLATYQSIEETHLSDLGRNEKQIEFDVHFNNLFLEKHPAYPLFQVWRQTARNLPQPVTPIPMSTRPATPAIEEIVEPAQAEAPQFEDTTTPPKRTKAVESTPPPAPPRRSTKPEPVREPDPEPEPVPEPAVYDDYTDDDAVRYEEAGGGDGLPWTAIATLAVVVIGIILMIVFFGIGIGGSDDATPTQRASTISTDVPTEAETDVPDTAVPTAVIGATLPPPTQTIPPTATVPTDTSTPDVPTDTPTPLPTNTPELPTDTPTDAVTDTPVVQPTFTLALTNSLFGAPPQNLLDSLNRMSRVNYVWDPNWFGQGAGGAWQLGNSKQIVGTGQIPVLFTPEFLDNTLGPNAAQRIVAIETEMELTLYDPADVSAGVFFGLGVENSSRERTGAEIRVAQSSPLIVNYGINQKGTFQPITQLPVSNIKVILRVERAPNGEVSFFVNNQLLGTSSVNYANQALTPVLYTSGGGVFVIVTKFEIELLPITQ